MSRHRLLGLALLAAAPLVATAWSPATAADSCRVMTVRYDVSGSGLVVLDPSHYDIPYGGCVQFVNQTAATATVTVGSHYAQQLGPNENTSGSTNFHGTASGQQPVTATSGPGSNQGNTAHGSITVGAAPKASPTPARSSSAPASSRPTPASSPARSAHPSARPGSAGGGPRVAPTPVRPRTSQRPRGGLHPPVLPPGPVPTETPSPTPSPTAAVATGPIEPASGRGVGLPAAVAALAVVGSGAGLVRVLAAEPVDSRETVADRT